MVWSPWKTGWEIFIQVNIHLTNSHSASRHLLKTNQIVCPPKNMQVKYLLVIFLISKNRNNLSVCQTGEWENKLLNAYDGILLRNTVLPEEGSTD